MRLAGFTLTSALVILIAWLASREVRVAILPGDGDNLANLAALLESQVSDRGGVAVVDRAAVASILREQKLQAMFSPDAVRSRMELGKLLKADLLVMLRSATAPEKGWELIACDTSQGLRLCVERVSPSRNATADLTQMQSLISRALKKHAENITQIVAVPPLVSNDLGLAAQMLQRPLAKIVEQALLQRTGIAVVEMSEAKAIAAEMTLTSGNEIIRKAPLYLMGEFRHDGFTNQSPVNFQLRLMRGDKQIGSRASTGNKLADAAIALPREAMELLDDANRTKPSGNALLPSADDEAKQLVPNQARLVKVRRQRWRKTPCFQA